MNGRFNHLNVFHISEIYFQYGNFNMILTLKSRSSSGHFYSFLQNNL